MADAKERIQQLPINQVLAMVDRMVMNACPLPAGVASQVSCIEQRSSGSHF